MAQCVAVEREEREREVGGGGRVLVEVASLKHYLSWVRH